LNNNWVLILHKSFKRQRNVLCLYIFKNEYTITYLLQVLNLSLQVSLIFYFKIFHQNEITDMKNIGNRLKDVSALYFVFSLWPTRNIATCTLTIMIIIVIISKIRVKWPLIKCKGKISISYKMSLKYVHRIFYSKHILITTIIILYNGCDTITHVNNS